MGSAGSRYPVVRHSRCGDRWCRGTGCARLFRLISLRALRTGHVSVLPIPPSGGKALLRAHPGGRYLGVGEGNEGWARLGSDRGLHLANPAIPSQLELFAVAGKRLCACDSAEPVRTRLGMASEGRAVDCDHAGLRLVSERPLEVVDEAPVQVTSHLDTCRQTGQNLSQGGSDVTDALLVEGGRDPALGDQDRGPAGTIPGPPNRVAQGVGNTPSRAGSYQPSPSEVPSPTRRAVPAGPPVRTGCGCRSGHRR